MLPKIHKGCNNYEIFTPDKISKQMAEYLNIDKRKKLTLLDPASGTGNLLKFLTNKYSSIECFEINKQLVKDIKSPIKLFLKDFLHHDFGDNKYDHIIMNPPYIKLQNLDYDYASFLKKTFNLKGNFDIYLPFLYKTLSILKQDGILVCITPNTFLYNKSFSKFREYILQNKLIQEIVDFKSEKVFDVNTYCCISVFTKKDKSSYKYNNEEIKYSQDYNNIIPIQEEQHKLSELSIISNGIATLRDKVFIHLEKKFDEPVWRPILKVSKNKMMWIIYPYQNKKIIDEENMRTQNPKTFEYLLSCKEELEKRDRGNKKYERWYAFGRRQGLMNEDDTNDKLYLSTLSSPDIQVIQHQNTLFYSGICISPKNNNIEMIKNILMINKKNIENMSSKRSGGFINITVSVLKKI